MTLVDDIIDALAVAGYTFAKGNPYDGTPESLVKNFIKYKYEPTSEGQKRWTFEFNYFCEDVDDGETLVDLLAELGRVGDLLYLEDFTDDCGDFVAIGGAALSILSGKMKVLNYSGEAKLVLSQELNASHPWEVSAKITGSGPKGFYFVLMQGTTWGMNEVCSVASNEDVEEETILINLAGGWDQVDTLIPYEQDHEYTITFKNFNWTAHTLDVYIDGTKFSVNMIGKSYGVYYTKIESAWFQTLETAPRYILVDDFRIGFEPFLPTLAGVSVAGVPRLISKKKVPGDGWKHWFVIKQEASEK